MGGFESSNACYEYAGDMALTFGLKTARDLFEKLQRDAVALEQEVSSDRLFNFVVTGYSLIDWIKNDPSVPATAKKAIGALYADRWIKVCRDLATASKHFSIDKRTPIIVTTVSERGYDIGRFGTGRFNVGEESIQIELDDGKRHRWDELVQGVLSTWQKFFDDHGI